MTDMVERVGRALDDAWNSEGKDLPPIELSQDERNYLARAVIEAMREPTDWSIEQGRRYAAAAGFDIPDEVVRNMYRAMIDAALAQGGEGE